MNNQTILHDIFSISKGYSGYILDAYGVFWMGNKAGLIPGAKDAMERLVKNGKVVGILSNTTQLAGNEISKLSKHGLIQGTHFHFLITSGEVAKQTFKTGELSFPTPRKTFWVLGTPHPTYSSHQTITDGSPFKEVQNLDDADFILTAIPHINGEDQTDPSKFEHLIDQIKNSGIRMVCTNPDKFAHEGSPPRPVVRQGSLAAMYERVGGKVYYFGKPEQLVFDVAMQNFKNYNVHDKKFLIMVGDIPETDIQGANNFGVDSALVMTGIMAERIAHQGREKALETITAKPTYFIERLGKV